MPRVLLFYHAAVLCYPSPTPLDSSKSLVTNRHRHLPLLDFPQIPYHIPPPPPPPPLAPVPSRAAASVLLSLSVVLSPLSGPAPPLPCPPHSTTADVSPPVRLSSFAPSFLVLHPHLDSVHRQASSVLASSCPILWSGSLPTTLHRRRRQPTGPCLLLCPLLPPSSICISIRSIASLRRRSVLFALLLGGLVVLLTVPCGAISNLASILLPLDAVLIAPGSLFRRQHKISHLSVLKNCLC